MSLLDKTYKQLPLGNYHVHVKTHHVASGRETEQDFTGEAKYLVYFNIINALEIVSVGEETGSGIRQLNSEYGIPLENVETFFPAETSGIFYTVKNVYQANYAGEYHDSPVLQYIDIDADIPIVTGENDFSDGYTHWNITGDEFGTDYIPHNFLYQTGVAIWASGLVKRKPKGIIYHDIYIESAKGPIHVHTHHDFENGIAQTYFNFGYADNNQIAFIGDGEYEYMGYSNETMGLLNQGTFEDFIKRGYENHKANLVDKLLFKNLSILFRDQVTTTQQIGGTSAFAIIKTDGTGFISDAHVPAEVSSWEKIRFFQGKPPQEVEDTTRKDDEMGDDQPTYDYGKDKVKPDEDLSKTDDIEEGSLEGSAGIFHDIYKVSDINMKSLHNKLWSQDYYSVLKVNENPIENIVSCKRFAFNMTGGTDKSIVIGNIDMSVNGTPLSQGIYKSERWTTNVLPKYGNFLDYYQTNITLFLPYVGYTPLDTHAFMNTTIGVEYLVDIMTGVCKARIYKNNELVMERDGQMGIDCTLTASTQKQSEIANAMRLANASAQIGMGIATGSGGSLASGVEGLLSNGITNHFQSTSSNAPISNASKIQCYLIYDRPIPLVASGSGNYPYPNAYGQTVGYPCYQTMTIGKCNGYTKVKGDVAFPSSLLISSDIKSRLLSKLQNGFEV